MNVVAAAVGGVVPKLLQLLRDEYKLQRSLKKKVKSLADELEYVHPFLCKVSDVPWYQLDDQVKKWASDIREASYNMEDILDTFLVRVEGCESIGKKRMMRALNNMTIMFRKRKAQHDIGSAIEEIMQQLRDVAARRDRYRIEDLVVNSNTMTSTTDPRLKAMYNEVGSLVGTQEPSKDLIAKLSVPQVDGMANGMKIVAIVGIGGLGKTTLAKVVYDKIRVDFDCVAFVPIGRNPNQSKLLMDILYELDKNRFDDIHTKKRDQRHLIDNLREFLKDKRYLIVIDDVWDTNSWEENIKLALLENNRGSRIIITTRNSEIATKIGNLVYRMQPLSEDNSKNLFYTRVFGSKVKWPDNEPDDISDKILKKCDGVPLAIITISSLLVGKPREKWSAVFSSVGFGHKSDKDMDNTLKILSFSYYDMPAHLRTCLLYLSVYPEDYEIDKESLIWMWIAEGFIQAKQGIQLFEIGEQHFNDLVNRSMIQAIEVVPGMVQKCRVHDMILDLICSISSKENFVTILDNDEGTESPPPRTVRRLALHDNTMEHTAQGNMMDLLHVRSCVAIRCAFGKWVQLSTFKPLRVLDMEGCQNVSPSHLVHLQNLPHLRYIGLRHTEIDALPNELGALKFLQTLDLQYTRIKQLPPSISHLTQLVCLKCYSLLFTLDWIENLSCLEELLVGIHFSNGNEKDNVRGFLKALGSLRNLRVFKLFVKADILESRQRDLVSSLQNLHKLQHLEIYLRPFVDADNSVWGQAGFVLPQNLRSLILDGFFLPCMLSSISATCFPNLTRLQLSVSVMDQKDLEFLGRLPELCYLELRTESTVTLSNINVGNSLFQKLRFCVMPWSMIQFGCKEGDSSISFHMWNGTDAMPFSSSKKDSSLAPYAMMPNLEVLYSWIFVRALKDSKVDYGSIIGLEHLLSLREVEFSINCRGASAVEVEEIKSAMRKAAELYPNRPTLRMFVSDKMVKNRKLDDDDVSAEED